MEYVISRIWKLKRPKKDDDDDLDYIVGSIIVVVALIVGYLYHT